MRVLWAVLAAARCGVAAEQMVLGPETTAAGAVPEALFSDLERCARLVDVAYCVGTAGTGVAPPFACASRCGDFPELRLVATWHTGVLMRDSCGYVAVDDGAREVLVAFRGTYSIANTVVDLSTLPQPYEPYEPGGGDGGGGRTNNGRDSDSDGDSPTCTNCTVHEGFWAAWASTRPLVVPVVAAARQPPSNGSGTGPGTGTDSGPGTDAGRPYRVHLIGHSLGGAVAALAALEMKAVLGWADVRVTTFGEPRVGNAGLAAFVDAVFGLADAAASADPAAAAYRRVTHKNDPVPLLPPADWGYRAHAGEVYIGKAGLPPAPADVRRCAGRDDPRCIAGDGGGGGGGRRLLGMLWELFFAHRDYFWRLGLCVPGGDPEGWPAGSAGAGG